jgi:thiamine biosynthesis lipoprotein
MASACLTGGGLATSGDYERCIEIDGRRYGHILHPATGWPVQGLCSVSVIADSCLLAGTLSTVAMLKSHQGTKWLDSLSVAHAWMDDAGAQGQAHWPTGSHTVAWDHDNFQASRL